MGGYPAAAGGYPNNTGVVGAGGYAVPSAGGVAGAYPLATNNTGVAPPPNLLNFSGGGSNLPVKWGGGVN